MVRRTGRRPVDPDAPVVDLDQVLADDRLIDEIAHRPPLIDAAPAGTADPARPVSRTAGPAGLDPTGPVRRAAAHRTVGRHRRGRTEPVIELLDEWRAELSARPLPATPVPPAPVSVRATPRRRTLRPMLAVAAAIGAVVIGSATMAAADADPNSPLWPVTQALWPDRATSIESAGAVRSAIADARAALDAGRPGVAQVALRRASDALAQVPAGDERDGMWQEVVALSVSAAPSARTSVGPSRSFGGVVAGPTGAAAVQPAGPSAAAAVPVEAPAGDGHHPPALAHPVEPSSASITPSTTSQASTAADGSPAGPVTNGGSPAAAASSGSDPAVPASSTPAAATPTPPPVTPTATTAASDPSGTTASSPAATQQSAPSPPATTSIAPSSSQSPAVSPADHDPADSEAASADAATDGSGSSDAEATGSGG